MRIIKTLIIVFLLITSTLGFVSCENVSNIGSDASEAVNISVGNWVIIKKDNLIFCDYPRGYIYAYDILSDKTRPLIEGYHAYKLFCLDESIYFFNRSDICLYRYSLESDEIVRITDVFDDIWLIKDDIVYGNSTNSSETGTLNRMIKYDITTEETSEICELDGIYIGFTGHKLAYSDSTFYNSVLTDKGVCKASIALNGEKNLLEDHSFSFVTKRYYYGNDDKGIYRINKKSSFKEHIISGDQILGVDGKRVFYISMEKGMYTLFIWQSGKSTPLLTNYPLSMPSLFDNKFHVLDGWVYFLSINSLQNHTKIQPLSSSADTKVYHYALSIDTQELVLLHISDLVS